MCIYKSFILCHLNYCPLIWHFTSKSNVLKLEKLQERTLRFVFNDYDSDYDALLAQADMPSLELSRLRQLATEVFKAMHNLTPPFISRLFHTEGCELEGGDKTNIKLRNGHKNSTRAGLRSFTYQGTKIWNNLPTTYKNATNLTIFKRLIKTWNEHSCTCNNSRSGMYVTNCS